HAFVDRAVAVVVLAVALLRRARRRAPVLGIAGGSLRTAVVEGNRAARSVQAVRVGALAARAVGVGRAPRRARLVGAARDALTLTTGQRRRASDVDAAPREHQRDAARAGQLDED